ncbi:single-stranded-DNA-specific exonuclease RecJ [Candidatus Microgenomates bacterium]|nr:single-stranded-DNA-specific exonuclease RecJ [Candidatus Microgenomates bacterium]
MKKKWEITNKTKSNASGSVEDILKILLENRGLTQKKLQNDFFEPKLPQKITLKNMALSSVQIKKAVQRLKVAKTKKEHVVVYGDYDADGICATAILWETLHKLGYDTMPYIPDRFKEGYGINPESVQKLKKANKNLKLIITVDNGIVAYDAIKKAKELGIDVIVTDHHQIGKKKLNALAVVHSTVSSGSAVSWILAREISKSVADSLDLVAIGTIADQMPLTGVSRSFVKHGLKVLNNTKRLGIRAIMRESRIQKAGTFEVGFILAPRLNAAGRLTHAIDSLRLLCTRNFYRANELSLSLGRVNGKRQKIVEEVLIKAEKSAKTNKDQIIVISDKNYHEGVIGLAAGKITGQYYRPSIVISENGDIAKASARSIPGFNIIKAIKQLDNLIIGGGGHPMAAGFSIIPGNINKFRKEINEFAKTKLTKKILTPKLKIDMELQFNQLNQELMDEMSKLDPFGTGNPQPVFVTKKVSVIEAKRVGAEKKHLKLKLGQGERVFDAIWFNPSIKGTLKPKSTVDVAYSLDENVYNGKTTLQLKVKDVKVG